MTMVTLEQSFRARSIIPTPIGPRESRPVYNLSFCICSGISLVDHEHPLPLAFRTLGSIIRWHVVEHSPPYHPSTLLPRFVQQKRGCAVVLCNLCAFRQVCLRYRKHVHHLHFPFPTDRSRPLSVSAPANCRVYFMKSIRCHCFPRVLISYSVEKL